MTSLNAIFLLFILRLLALSLLSAAAQAVALKPLEIITVLPVESAITSGLQPSGLARCNDELLMVSDRHNSTVFKIKMKADLAQVVEHQRLHNIPKPSLKHYDFGTQWWSNLSRRYDWEGISCQQGNVYLLSETLSQILAINVDGQMTWLGEKSYLAGRGKGLFEHRNAKAEGLAINENHVFIAAERQPRGIVASSLTEPSQATAFYLEGFPDFFQPQDFSGLIAENSHLYTLERNHFKVCRRLLTDFSVEHCWSYEAIEKSPRWKYQDQRFGKAEGIAKIQDRLYVILDNNNDSRAADPHDRRPLLLVFKVPKDW